MEWNKGFSAAYYACIVDRTTWKDIERFEIKSGAITKSDTALIEAADVETRYVISGERWIRIYMDARQNGAAENVALFTGLAAAPQQTIQWGRSDYEMECYSVLKPAEDVLLPRGYFVPEGANGGSIIKTLLKATPAPVVIEGEMPKLKNNIIAEQGENNLSMTIKVLQAINRRIRISGDGTITVCRKAAAPSAVYDALENDCVEPTVSITRDWFDCPNVFRAISDAQMAVARDEDPDSSLSIISRGREVWMEESSCNLNDGEGIAAYARRRLKEEQARGYEISYSRRYDPNVTISDLVGLRYPAQGLNKDYRVISQRITLESGCRTEEEVEYR